MIVADELRAELQKRIVAAGEPEATITPIHFYDYLLVTRRSAARKACADRGREEPALACQPRHQAKRTFSTTAMWVTGNIFAALPCLSLE
jgi:hypothetical protein